MVARIETGVSFASNIGTINVCSASRYFGWLATATDQNRRPNRDRPPVSAFARSWTCCCDGKVSLSGIRAYSLNVQASGKLGEVQPMGVVSMRSVLTHNAEGLHEQAVRRNHSLSSNNTRRRYAPTPDHHTASPRSGYPSTGKEPHRELTRALPRTIKVYRATDDHDDGGLSWTLSYTYAQEYARMFQRNTILTRMVEKSEVYALIERNGEEEILIL